MKKIIPYLLLSVLVACTAIEDKIPKRKACTGENNTLADLICKK